MGSGQGRGDQQVRGRRVYVLLVSRAWVALASTDFCHNICNPYTSIIDTTHTGCCGTLYHSLGGCAAQLPGRDHGCITASIRVFRGSPPCLGPPKSLRLSASINRIAYGATPHSRHPGMHHVSRRSQTCRGLLTEWKTGLAASGGCVLPGGQHNAATRPGRRAQVHMQPCRVTYLCYQCARRRVTGSRQAAVSTDLARFTLPQRLHQAE